LIFEFGEHQLSQLISAALSRQRQEWEELATLDPLWAILADDRKKFGGWDLNDFLQTGSKEVDAILETARALGYPKEYHRALDFGCGVGRLSWAIGRNFQQCVGVDISPAMISMAKKLNPGREFYVLDSSQLKGFANEEFDFIYSNIVLQHQPTEPLVFGYVSEFLRILRRGGLLVFQVPHHIPLRYRLEPRRRAYRLCRLLRIPPGFLYSKLKLNPITMRAIPQERVVAAIDARGGHILRVAEDKNGGPHIESRTYFVSR
jgi:SAM-dependent methyltransferase